MLSPDDYPWISVFSKARKGDRVDTEASIVASCKAKIVHRS